MTFGAALARSGGALAFGALTLAAAVGWPTASAACSCYPEHPLCRESCSLAFAAAVAACGDVDLYSRYGTQIIAGAHCGSSATDVEELSSEFRRLVARMRERAGRGEGGVIRANRSGAEWEAACRGLVERVRAEVAGSPEPEDAFRRWRQRCDLASGLVR